MLSKLSKKVITLEIVPELAEKAKNKINKLEIKNIEVQQKDFRNLKQKYDKIVFTAGIEKEQEQIIEDFAKNHLKENGILICPYKEGPLVILENKKGKIKKTCTEENYVFVPLILK